MSVSMKQCNYNRTVNSQNDSFLPLIEVVFPPVHCGLCSPNHRNNAVKICHGLHDFYSILPFSVLVSFLKNFMNSRSLVFFLRESLSASTAWYFTEGWSLWYRRWKVLLKSSFKIAPKKSEIEGRSYDKY